MAHRRRVAVKRHTRATLINIGVLKRCVLMRVCRSAALKLQITSQEQKANKWRKVFLPNPVRVLESVGVSDGFSVLDTVISACRAPSLFCVSIGSVSGEIKGGPDGNETACTMRRQCLWDYPKGSFIR